MTRFTLPRDVFFGENSLRELSHLTGKRAMLVTGGSSMRNAGFLREAEEALQQAGMECRLLDGVEPDPSLQTVQRGAREMEAFGPDWIVAIGGGSPMDAAKAMWVFYEHPQLHFSDLITPFSFPALRKKARFCAIPSTSGSASEVTAFSVITDKETGIKYPLADFEITPDVAILDPRMAVLMPQTLAAHTGMDALTHAVEAYVSKEANPFTDPLALSAAETIFETLPASYAGSRTARASMHYAQCMAGMAFSNALLGFCHALAHKTGAAFSVPIPHGLANALFLPYVMAFNAKEERALSRYAFLAQRLGLRGINEQALTQQLILAVRRLCRLFALPETLSELVSPAEFQEKKQAIARAALEDACTASNPRAVTEEDARRLLDCIYDGQAVTF